jgi:PE-PPE domain
MRFCSDAEHHKAFKWQVGYRSCVVVLASAAVVAGLSTAPEPHDLRLAALITPANSTAQIFAGANYYGQDWSPFGQQQVVPFFFGPQGIVTAIDNNSADPTGTVVLSSGWGAGQTSTALAAMQANHDPSIDSVRLAILDNDTNRAGGGFWTTYWMFAPLLSTSAAPTPSDTMVPVVDTAYAYNINSDAPTYPINLLADINSLAAYFEDYGAQATAPMPAAALQPVTPGAQHYHYIVAPDGTVTRQVAVSGNITYVTFESGDLPLLKPLRLLPGGGILADALEPALTVLVDWGYQDNNPIPDDPTTTRPVGLLPSLSQDVAAVQQLAAAIGQGMVALRRDLTPSIGAAKTTAPQGISSRAADAADGDAAADSTAAVKRRQASATAKPSAESPEAVHHARPADTAPRAQHRNPSADTAEGAPRHEHSAGTAAESPHRPAGIRRGHVSSKSTSHTPRRDRRGANAS